jgi:hypothetical protein
MSGAPAPVNNAIQWAMGMMRSEVARADATLAEDFTHLLAGQCIYLPNLMCATADATLFDGLKPARPQGDTETHMTDGMVPWSQHQRHENPAFSPHFQRIVAQLAEYFDVEVYASRLNFYRDGRDWKPFHHDSHAYASGKDQREDFTIGVSFGARRDLAFLHEPSGRTFAFPQHNGDVFAFTTEVNQRFKHGIPRLPAAKAGERFSIIVWGRRRRLTARNGGAAPPTLPTPLGPPSRLFYPSAVRDHSAPVPLTALTPSEPGEIGSLEVAPAKKAPKKKGRLQGASAGQ